MWNAKEAFFRIADMLRKEGFKIFVVIEQAIVDKDEDGNGKLDDNPYKGADNEGGVTVMNVISPLSLNTFEIICRVDEFDLRRMMIDGHMQEEEVFNSILFGLKNVGNKTIIIEKPV